ncbi:MAG: hypothetical protein AB8F95_15365 [Bacteroidia bacterium]
MNLDLKLFSVFNKMKYSKFGPMQETPFESGEISIDQLEDMYKSFPWIELLNEKNNRDQYESERSVSPAILLEHEDGKELVVSIVGEEANFKFYILYTRPFLKKKRKWFRTIEYWDDFQSIIPQQTKKDGLEALRCFMQNDFETIEAKWG